MTSLVSGGLVQNGEMLTHEYLKVLVVTVRTVTLNWMMSRSPSRLHWHMFDFEVFEFLRLFCRLLRVLLVSNCSHTYFAYSNEILLYHMYVVKQ